jgi:hypothetical protein
MAFGPYQKAARWRSSTFTAVSLTPVGDSIVRSVLSSLFGLNANTLIRVDTSPGSCMTDVA